MILTFPSTLNEIPELCVNELAVLEALNVSDEALPLVFNVYDAPVAKTTFGKSVPAVPPIVFDEPVNVTV